MGDWHQLCPQPQSEVNYLDIRGIPLTVFPGLGNAGKDAVGMIKLATLQVEEQGGEWFLRHKEALSILSLVMKSKNHDQNRSIVP